MKLVLGCGGQSSPKRDSGEVSGYTPIEALELPDAQCEKILWKHAAGLLKLDL